MSHLLVRNGFRSDVFKSIYPRVSNAIAELFFLSPCYLFWQQVGKGLSHNLLLNNKAVFSSSHIGGGWEGATHLSLRIGTHSDIEELLVKEWHTTLYTPSRQTFVCTQAVIEMEL